MTLSYDGHNLESLFICGEPQISILNFQPELKEVQSRNGALFVGSRLGTSTVAFTIAAVGTMAERRDKFSTLGQWLTVTSPKWLILPESPTTNNLIRRYSAVPSGALDIQHGVDGDWAVLTFTLIDPVGYSYQQNTVTSSGGIATFTVGGTAPTYVEIKHADNYITTDDEGRWGVGVGTSSSPSTYIYAQYTGTVPANLSLTIDTAKRLFSFSGQYMPALGSTWFQLNPGSNTIKRLYGSREFKVNWYDRWY